MRMRRRLRDDASISMPRRGGEMGTRYALLKLHSRDKFRPRRHRPLDYAVIPSHYSPAKFTQSGRAYHGQQILMVILPHHRRSSPLDDGWSLEHR